MKSLRIGFALVLIPMVFLVFKSANLPAQEISNADELQTALTNLALASLKAEYDVLVTGNRPTNTLIPQRDGMTHLNQTGEERFATALRRREIAINIGRPFASIEVQLKPQGIKKVGDKIILHAIEEETEHFTYSDPARSSWPKLTESRTNHDFVFSITSGTVTRENMENSFNLNEFNYTLLEDRIEPQLIKK